MSLLSICTQVANDCAIAAPSSIVGNSDETAIRLLAAAQLEGQALARKPQGGWVASIREFTFTTEALGPVSGSVANSGANGVAVITVSDTTGIEAYTWYAFGYGCPNNAVITEVTPTTVTLNQPATDTGSGSFTFGKSDYDLPSDFQRPIDNTMWDRTLYWQMRGPMSPQQWQFYKSTMVATASIQKRFRFRRFGSTPTMRFSIDPVPQTSGDELVFEYVSNAWCQSDAGAAQTQWEADTDTGILDEYLMTLGVRWRFLRRLGLSYSEELDEYDREVSKAMAVDGGAPILSLVPGPGLSLIGPWNVQDGNWPGNLGSWSSGFSPGFGG